MVLPKQRLFFSAAISKQTIKTISSYPLLYLVNDKKENATLLIILAKSDF